MKAQVGDACVVCGRPLVGTGGAYKLRLVCMNAACSQYGHELPIVLDDLAPAGRGPGGR